MILIYYYFRSLSKQLYQNFLVDLCETLFENKNYDEIIYKIQYFLSSVTWEDRAYYLIQKKIMSSFLQKMLIQQAIQIYDDISSLTKKVFGLYNPIMTSFQDILSARYLEIGQYENAIEVSKLSLINNIKGLGMNHLSVIMLHFKQLQTGQSYEKMADIYQCLNDRTKSFEHFQQACLIYESKVLQSVFHQNKMSYQKELTEKFANLNFKISNILILKYQHREALDYLRKAIKLYEKFPKYQGQLLVSYQLALSSLIVLQDYQKGLTICDKIWSKLQQQKITVPQKYEQVFKQGFVIIIRKLKREEQYRLLMSLSKYPDQVENSPKRVFEYQNYYEKLMIALGNQKTITDSLNKVVLTLSSKQKEENTDNDLDTLIIGFIGKSFFQEEIENISK